MVGGSVAGGSMAGGSTRVVDTDSRVVIYDDVEEVGGATGAANDVETDRLDRRTIRVELDVEAGGSTRAVDMD